jgi:hypothetical protein
MELQIACQQYKFFKCKRFIYVVHVLGVLLTRLNNNQILFRLLKIIWI